MKIDRMENCVKRLAEFGPRLVRLADGQAGLRSMLPVEIKADAKDTDLLSIRASDETLDRYNEVISAAGWKLDNYRRNPVIQDAHNYGSVEFTIGTALVTEIRDGALMQVWKFATAANPLAKIARDLYRDGFLRACSVGFDPVAWDKGGPEDSFRRKYTEQELLEVSAVSIPANPNALTAGLSEGTLLASDVRELKALLAATLARAERRGIYSLEAGSGPDSGAEGTAADAAQVLVRLNETRALLRSVMETLKRA